MALLNFMSFLPIFRQPLTASTLFFRLYDLIVLESIEAAETKVMDVLGTRGANMGRMRMGWTVGMEALGSPWMGTEMLARMPLAGKEVDTRVERGVGEDGSWPPPSCASLDHREGGRERRTIIA